MFPVVIGDSMLYFSSNGFGGMGGLDILSCKIKNDVVISEAKLLPYPINSSGDDFGIVYFSEGRGIFTSNRNGGKGDDDFYYFTYAPVFLHAKGKVIDKNTRLPLAQTLITLSINDTIIDTTYTNNEGDYFFENIINDKKYIIKAIKRDYIPQEKELMTYGEKISRTLSSENGHNIDFELFKLTKEEIVINNIYYDFDKWTLRPESFVELNKIVEILKENSQMIIQINSHTDARGSDQYNQVLSEKRAQSVVDYLISKGISPSRLKYKGWGESNLLIKDAQTEEEHQLNRRTTFNLVNIDEWNQSYFDQIYSNVSEQYNEKSFFNHQIYIGSSLNNNIDSVIFTVTQYDTNLKVTKIVEDGIDRYYLGPFFLYDDAYFIFEKIKLIQPNAYIAIFKNDKPIGKIQLN
jgi:outer membrane protein OmpA-like peptidoglycan-associated protein